ncbi:MAG: peptidoglycan DD-metalloendopeptidase family protein [Methylobacter sp.]|uniref:peptidoglycan DD-metalloendopeptidase family protein n=1 Tax=Methylobacter sp. TaxID=2051955 RepID=UPI002730D5E9|nr:peptidoglycan DD-metalloendopeptidase family protein [Methylobacter sp.]MDP1666773.1 peptidoglycan DD-metalloendopeptidase family protein [Methylobacter sp.]
MTSATPKLIFLVILSALLHGCTSVSPNYAPVSTNYPDTSKYETKYYQVKKGDTLSAISLIYDLDYRQLALWNRIAPPYTIEIGQKIRLSDPNPENTPMHDRMDAGVQKKAKQNIATATNRISSQKKTAISLDTKSNLTYKPLYNSQPFNKIAVKNGSSPQKKSIISIDNGNMLKLNFQWPIKGKVLKYFSQAGNKGIDIAGKMGQDVSAAEAGKVVYSGQGLIGYGNLLIIKHNDLYLSAYANNSRLLVAEGYTVEKGEVIAKVGRAGSNKTSLHFEIRKNGKPVNPVNFLPENN